jgi:hypothetical protein
MLKVVVEAPPEVAGFKVTVAAAAAAVRVTVAPDWMMTVSPATGPLAPHPACQVAPTFQLPPAVDVQVAANAPSATPTTSAAARRVQHKNRDPGRGAALFVARSCIVSGRIAKGR